MRALVLDWQDEHATSLSVKKKLRWKDEGYIGTVTRSTWWLLGVGFTVYCFLTRSFISQPRIRERSSVSTVYTFM